MQIKIAKDGKPVITDFSPVQAYKIAVKMEKNGIAFYEGLSKKIKDEEARREIDFLIEQEEDHLRTFQGLLGKAKEVAGDDFEEDDIVDYMNSRVFDAALEVEEARRVDHRHTALEEAMQMERRSIFFYEGCLKYAQDPAAQKTFKNIIEEEKKHLMKFAELLRIKCVNSAKGCIL
jgi:rubrerythrin